MQPAILNHDDPRWPACLARLLLVLLACLTLLQTGCVRRRLMIRSQPAGALVYVDNQQVGTTPCAVDFTYYGTREIRLVKSGYETLTVDQPIPTPWYQIIPLDFISENLVPYKIRDNRTVSFNLSPAFLVPSQELLDRAEMLRQETMRGAVMPAGAVAPLGAPQAVPGEMLIGPAVGPLSSTPPGNGPDILATPELPPYRTQTIASPASSSPSGSRLLPPPNADPGRVGSPADPSGTFPSITWPPSLGAADPLAPDAGEPAPSRPLVSPPLR